MGGISRYARIAGEIMTADDVLLWNICQGASHRKIRNITDIASFIKGTGGVAKAAFIAEYSARLIQW